MPPTPPSPQGSRAGLITALVTFVVLFATATVFAIYYGTQWQGLIVKSKSDVDSLNEAVRSQDLQSPDVQNVNSEGKKLGESGILYALHERDEVKKLVTGNPAESVADITADAQRSVDDVNKQLASANPSAKTTIGPDNLLASIKLLSNQVVALSTSVSQAQAKADAAGVETKKAIERQEAIRAEDKKAVDAAVAESAAAKKAKEDREGEGKTNVEAIQKAADDAVKAAQAQTVAAQAELTKLQGLYKKSVDDLVKTQAKLAAYRLDPTRSLMREAGHITRSPGNDVVFIDLGEGQEISPGLTFEVYDQRKGLPQLVQGNTPTPQLPEGKASIEVLRAMPGTSECRVIHQATGSTIAEGDLILNIVYNTHVKFSFCVYGSFDLGQTGTATPGEADIVRRLINQWGGRVMDTVNVDTDFLVMGKEPVVSPLPENPTPIDTERHEKQVADLDAYIKILDLATHLTVPILNQNRFLYFTGYFDQAKR